MGLKNTSRVMVDLETFGSGVSAPIVQIGAYYFNGPRTGDCFDVNVNAEDAIKNGAVAEAGSIYWWLQQSDDARKSISFGERVDEVQALWLLNSFLQDADEIWSHATFDFVLVMEAMRRRGVKPTFGFRCSRDIRTLAALSAGKVDTSLIVREGTQHCALEDAKFQAKYCAAMIGALEK